MLKHKIAMSQLLQGLQTRDAKQHDLLKMMMTNIDDTGDEIVNINRSIAKSASGSSTALNQAQVMKRISLRA